MMTIKKPKATPTQKKIKHWLIDHEISMTDIANLHGVTPQAINGRLLRQDEEFFKESIEEINKIREQECSSTGTDG